MVLSHDDILVNVSNTEKQIVNGPFGSYFFRYSVFLCIQSECGKVREKCGPELLRIRTLFTQCFILTVIFEVTIGQNLIIDDIITYIKIYSKQYNEPDLQKKKLF